MKSALILAIASVTMVASACSQSSAPDSVDRMPRGEVEAIIAEYLVKNPEALEAGLLAVDAMKKEQLFGKLASNANDPSLGPSDAPITIVEFFDYNCGYCRQANDWVLEQIDAREGDIRIVFKEYPILAESSLKAAQAAHAANLQGKYREMHVALMKSPDLSIEGIEKAAKSIGLDVERLKKDMESPSTLAQIERVYGEAAEAGVEGTPGFYVNGEFLNGYREEALAKMVTDARKDL